MHCQHKQGYRQTESMQKYTENNLTQKAIIIKVTRHYSDSSHECPGIRQSRQQ